jgi:hypothetical protein
MSRWIGRIEVKRKSNVYQKALSGSQMGQKLTIDQVLKFNEKPLYMIYNMSSDQVSTGLGAQTKPDTSGKMQPSYPCVGARTLGSSWQ